MRDTLLLLLHGREHRILRLTVLNWLLGMTLGMACAGLFVAFDIGGLRELLVRPDRVVWEGFALLFGGFAITFGGGVCAAAVMTVPLSDDGPPSGPRVRADDGAPAPAKAAAAAPGTGPRDYSHFRRS